MDRKEQIQKLVGCVKEKDAIGFSETFESFMSDHILEKMNEIEQGVCDNFFGGKDE